MKNNVLIAAILIFTMNILVTASDLKLDAATLKEIGDSIKVLQQPNLRLESGIDKGSIYFLKVNATSSRGSQIFDTFIDKQTGFVYFGSAFDADGKQLVFPKDAKVIKEGVVFSYGKGAKELYLVTDPECSYCTKFEKEAEGKLEDYTVHVIFYPLPFHNEAPAMIEWILQGKSDAEKKARLNKIALENSIEYQNMHKDVKKPFTYTSSTQKIMDRSFKAVSELGTRGTPTTYDADFNAIPWTKLVNTEPGIDDSKKQ